MLALAAGAWGQTAVPQDPSATGQATAARTDSARPVDKAIRIQRDARKQWQELIQAMHQVALQLEKTDPETAAAIGAAAQKAEEAFIAEDMDKVIQLLQTGLIVPADATQAKVVLRLREVLETLRGGGKDLDGRILKLEQMRRLAEAMKEILQRQRRLEGLSRALAFGSEVLDRVGEAEKQLQALRQRQRELQKRLQQSQAGTGVHRLTAAGRALRALLRRQEGLIQALSDPFPSPDKLAENIASGRQLRQEVNSARIEFKTLTNDPAVAGELQAGGAAEAAAGVLTGMGKAMDELARSAAGLEKDDLKEAQVAAQEALTCLRECLAALDTAMGKLGGPSAGSLAEQQRLTEQAQALERLVDDLAPEAETSSAGPDEQAASSYAPVARKHMVERSIYGRRTQDTAMSPMATALQAATDALGKYDKDSAATEQARALEVLEGWAGRLSGRRQQVEQVRKDPQYPRQQTQQQQIADEVGQVSRGQVPGEPPPPGGLQASVVQGDLQVALSKAAEHAGDAADSLGRQKAHDANRDQNEVIRLLEHVAEEMQSIYEVSAQVLLEELSEQWLAALERVVLAQKRCSADTIEIWQKRQADGSFRRAEQIALLAAATAQGKVLAEMDAMETLMSMAKRAHSRVVFPPVVPFIISLVRQDVDRARQRLTDKDPGRETQRLQRDIEERLEGMLKAMRPDGGSMSTPPQWADNSWGSPDVSRTDRVAEVQMLLLLQGQINRRTEELEKAKASLPPRPGQAGQGQDRAQLHEEFRTLAEQQARIGSMVEQMLLFDLTRWDRRN